MARIGSKCSACLSIVDGRSDMRNETSSMRAVFSARSMLRAIQNRFSAVRLSIVSSCAALQNPSVLGAAALARIDDERAFAKRHSRQAAGNNTRLLAGEHEGPQVDVARNDLAVNEGRRGGERQGGLRDVIFGIAHYAKLVGLA